MVSDEQRPRPRHNGLKVTTVMLLVIPSLLLAVGGVSFALWGHQQAVASDASHSLAVAKMKRQDAATAKAAAAAAAAEAAQAAAAQHVLDVKAANDSKAAALGFRPSPTDGNVYYKSAPTGINCNSGVPCADIDIFAVTNCSSGIYISANLLTSGNIVLANGNDITGGLAPNQGAMAEVDFPGASSEGDHFDVTDAHCL